MPFLLSSPDFSSAQLTFVLVTFLVALLQVHFSTVFHSLSDVVFHIFTSERDAVCDPHVKSLQVLFYILILLKFEMGTIPFNEVSMVRKKRKTAPVLLKLTQSVADRARSINQGFWTHLVSWVTSHSR